MHIEAINDNNQHYKVATKITSCINRLHTGRISLLKVAENIITCLSWGVNLKISWTSFRMSIVNTRAITQERKSKSSKHMSICIEHTKRFKHFVALI